MDPFNNADEATNSDTMMPSSTKRYRAFILAVLTTQMLVSFFSYPFLPEIVPTHWDINGQVDGYAHKLVNAILFPAVTIGLYILLHVFATLGPKLKHEAQHGTREFLDLLMAGISLFFLIAQLTVTAIGLGIPVDLPLVFSLAISLLFIWMGNYMGKIRRNYWAGIRTPWTLANDTTWERTHRVGGWLFVAGGLFGVVLSFVPYWRFWGTVGVSILIVLFLFFYSYQISQRLQTKGE